MTTWEEQARSILAQQQSLYQVIADLTAEMASEVTAPGQQA